MRNNNNDVVVDIDDIEDDLNAGSFADISSFVEDDGSEAEYANEGGIEINDNIEDIDDLFRDIEDSIEEFNSSKGGEENDDEDYDDEDETGLSVIDENSDEDEDYDDVDEDDYYDITLPEAVIEKLQSGDKNLISILEAYAKGETEGVADYLIGNNLIKLVEEESDFISRLDSVSDDELIMHEVKERCTNCSASELEGLKFSLQQSSAIDNLVKGLRDIYKSKEVELYNNKKAEERVARERQYSEYNADLSEQIHNLDIIAGPFKNNQQMKKEFLPKIKKSMDGDTTFVKELLDNPVNQYKALFYLEMEDKIQDYYKGEVEKAYKKGLSEARKTTSTKRVSKSPGTKSTKTNKNGQEEKFLSLDDL